MKQTMCRAACAVSAALGALTGIGCISAPSYSQPVFEDKATLVPGLDSSKAQLAHWTCPLSEQKTKDGSAVTSPPYELVLYQDPKGGLMLHELNNDWLMANPEMIPGGGAVFAVTIPGLGNEFIVPPDREQELTHHFRSWYVGLSYIETEKLTQMCHRGPPVRIL